MRVRLVLLLFVMSQAGCTRYHSRNSSPPQARMPSPYAPRTDTPSGVATRSPLAVPASTAAPGKPGAAEPTEVSLVPPLPREAVPKDYVVQPPKTPSEADRTVVPTSGSLPSVTMPPTVPTGTLVSGQPGKLEKDPRPEPSPNELPSPFAKGDAAPAGAGNGANSLDKAQQLATTAMERWKTIDTYEARLTRHEIVGGKSMPEEEMLYRVRREPFALSMKTTGENGKGREVLYNPSQHGDKMHIIVGAGDSFFLKAGTRAPSMSPDSRAVMEKSRHSIRDAGFGNSIARFQGILDKVKAGRLKPDALAHAGPESRKDMPGFTLERVDQTVAPGEDPMMPRGGKRHWYFDVRRESVSFGMPVLVVTMEGGRQVEYYRFDQFRIPAGLTDADFDPENLGKKK